MSANFKYLKYILLSVIAFYLLSISSLVYAQEKKGIEVFPAYTEVTLEGKDDEEKIEFTYINHTENPIILEFQPLDFRSDPNGIINFFEHQEGYQYSLSSFLSLESSSISLNPKEERKLIVSVKNREDISPGGHYAAIMAKILDNDPEKASNIVPSLNALILLRKSGGEIFKASLTDSNYPTSFITFSYPFSLQIGFRNEGNIHIIPYGTVQIKDIFGRNLYQGVINGSSNIVMPESRRQVPVELHAVDFSLPISLNTLKVEGKDSLNKITYSKTYRFLYINPFSSILILLPIGLGLLFLRKRRKASAKV